MHRHIQFDFSLMRLKIKRVAWITRSLGIFHDMTKSGAVRLFENRLLLSAMCASTMGFRCIFFVFVAVVVVVGGSGVVCRK